MIRRVYADLPRFKEIRLSEGLNLLLAERTKGSKDTQTRNAAGKSSLLEILHFLLGADCPPESIFRHAALRDAVFGMEFDLADAPVSVQRSGASQGKVSLVSLDSTDASSLGVKEWRNTLGREMFDLGAGEGAWSPSFRSMISYFVRRDAAGGIADPMRSSAKQQLVDQQVSISRLLGLDWRLPREWQAVRDREKNLLELKKAIKNGTLGTVVGTASELKSELIIAEDRTRGLRAAASSFKVIEEYDQLEREASDLTRRIGELADENVLDRRYLAEIEASSNEEIPPAAADLETLFREAGTVLPDLVRQRFEQAQAFHESVIRNRSLYLEAEAVATRTRLLEREAQQRAHDARRAEIMQLLESAGALEHFAALQGELARTEAATESLRQRHASAEALESGQVQLKAERALLSERLRRGYADDELIIEDAVLTFRKVSAELYGREKAGTLTITPSENGPEFAAHLPAEQSKGINNMRIFCFDMMLMLLSVGRGVGPRFLVHDSHMFDGVDERQVAKALMVGATLAHEHKFQYVVAMNSDSVPRSGFSTGFDLTKHVVEARLTDETDSGGLFGFRFEAQRR